VSDDRPQAEEYLANEDDLLRGLLEAAEASERQTATVEISRKGKVYFRFRIRPLSEREYNACRDKATKYHRSRQFGGLRLPEDTDATRFRSLLIYTATVEDDRKRLWDSKEAQRKLDVLNGPDLIDRVLLAGEKDAVVARIDELSGFGSDLEEQAKNS